MCNQHNVTAANISDCQFLAKSEHVYKHNKISGYIHWTIFLHYNIKSDTMWHKHVLSKTQDNHQATILRDTSVQTDKEIKVKRLHIIVKDWDKTPLLIDIAVTFDWNIDKEVKKLSKFKYLMIEVFKMWAMNAPIIIGALEMLEHCTKKNVEAIPGCSTVHTIQNIPRLGSAGTLRNRLSIH